MNKNIQQLTNNKTLDEDCTKILEAVNFKKFKNSKILILGGNSFIATYIQAALSLIKCEIVSVSLNKPRGLFKKVYKNSKIKFIQTDLNETTKLKKILKKNFDFIFHCATYGQPKKWDENILSTVNLNINVLKLVLEHSKKYKSRILYLSSTLVYAIPDHKAPINESSPLGVGKFPTEMIYTNAKIIGEQLCKIYKKKYNIPVYIVRPGHTYGPGQDFKDPRVIPQILKRAALKKKIYIHDNGKSVRTWGYIADITVMLLNIIQYGKSLTYNVSGTDHKSIMEICKIVSKIYRNIPISIIHKKLNYTYTKSTILKISSKKYNAEFKNNKQTSFVTGINKLINWNKE
jgi:dTDP-glucose 4,6-dehydratase/UDP-glucuronate decarboxylase|tara:strand:+ start:188 stop:1225 length:1038 start_codon:yes stop_codon:yes gene_type:complete